MTIATKVVNEVAAEKAADVAEERVVDEAERETEEGVGGEIGKKIENMFWKKLKKQNSHRNIDPRIRPPVYVPFLRFFRGPNPAPPCPPDLN